MSYDPVDVFGGAIGSLFKRVGLFFSAVLVGLFIGLLSLVAAWLASGRPFAPQILGFVFSAPGPLPGDWLILNFATLLIGFACFVRLGGGGLRGWMFLVGLVSLGVRLVEGQLGWLPRLAGWATWLILLGMLATGVWLLWQHFINRWALHMADVRAEISVREANADALVRERLAANRPPVPPPGVEVELKR